MATSALPYCNASTSLPCLDRRNVLPRVIGSMAIRALMKYAVEIGLREDNPAIGVKLPNLKTDGYHSWTEAEIETI